MDWEKLKTVKDDCFAYNNQTGKCNALNDLYCRKGECNFYKNRHRRCYQCQKAKGRSIECAECLERNLK